MTGEGWWVGRMPEEDLVAESNNVWKTFFDHHAPRYLDEVFTRNTDEEVKFLLTELGLSPGAWLLDVGCGVGRHAVPLAQAGLRVVGLDLSSGMLRQGQARARDCGVDVGWVQADATRFGFGRPFEAAICLCEGSFGLIGAADCPESHERLILTCLQAALVPGAKFILTALNGMAKIRAASQESIDQGTFDPLYLTERMPMQYETPEGPRSVSVRERGFVPSELRLLLECCGFEIEHIFGGTAGNWGRRPVDLDEIELMVIAHRAPGLTWQLRPQ